MALMGDACCDSSGLNLCLRYLPAIIENFEANNLNCPARIAGYMAQIRHETAGLQTLYQCRDNGAGAIHMIPSNFRVACLELPDLKAAFENRFGSCRGGGDAEAAQIVSCPTLAFETASWWMTGGGSVCPGHVLVNELDKCRNLGTSDSGFRKISRCILGVDDPGQRDDYYLAALDLVRSYRIQNGTNVAPDEDLMVLSVNASAVVLPPLIPFCSLHWPCNGTRCCSQFGFCGTGDEYCGAGCQIGNCRQFDESQGVPNTLITVVTFTVATVLLLLSAVMLGCAWRIKQTGGNVIK